MRASAGVRQLPMSARAYPRTLKLAGTVADLADPPCIETAHLAEAIHLRPPPVEDLGP